MTLIATKLVSQTNTGASARLAANWLSSLQRLKIDDRAHIYCTDSASVNQLSSYAFNAGNAATISGFKGADWHELPPQTKHPYGTHVFTKLMLWKLELLRQLSEWREFESFLYCDADTVLLRDPELSLQKERTAQPGQWLYFQSDREDYQDPAALPPPASGTRYCAGVIYQRRPETLLWAAAYQWLKIREHGAFQHDQHAINAIMDGWARVPGILSPQWCRNGAVDWNNDPVLVHGNYSSEHKETRFKRVGCWFADDALLTKVGL